MKRETPQNLSQDTLFKNDTSDESGDFYTQEQNKKLFWAQMKAFVPAGIALIGLFEASLAASFLEKNPLPEDIDYLHNVVNLGLGAFAISGASAAYFYKKQFKLEKTFETKQLDFGINKGPKGKFTKLI